jgi:hypothetical protein
MRKTDIDRALGPTLPKKGSQYTTAQRHAGLAARQVANEKIVTRALDTIFAELLPFLTAMKAEH